MGSLRRPTHGHFHAWWCRWQSAWMIAPKRGQLAPVILDLDEIEVKNLGRRDNLISRGVLITSRHEGMVWES